ncbi:Hypothetical protein CAP_7103 [Chondromyces apiculatus DSM 436]|uniref:Uncharacterized protein n=1 Tax=Chondromyces apiculatus DSM 436 TaxID=1192034 RepID=A0A017T1R1_9BACT|nr:Hypothetical protein CAP_7103 [Chondromyces apiculatus DSM 436]
MGPGLSKSRPPSILRRRVVELWSTTEGEVRALFEAADVVSEGAARVEGDALVYYGSSSVLLVPPDPATIRQLGYVLAQDPHARVRALRIAHREASARAGGTLTRVQAEISFGEGPGQVRMSRGRPALAIGVDVSAVVIAHGAKARHA